MQKSSYGKTNISSVKSKVILKKLSRVDFTEIFEEIFFVEKISFVKSPHNNFFFVNSTFSANFT